MHVERPENGPQITKIGLCIPVLPQAPAVATDDRATPNEEVTLASLPARRSLRMATKKKSRSASSSRGGQSRKPKPPFKRQHQRRPGLESKLDPLPRYEAPEYRGSGKLDGFDLSVIPRRRGFQQTTSGHPATLGQRSSKSLDPRLRGDDDQKRLDFRVPPDMRWLKAVGMTIKR